MQSPAWRCIHRNISLGLWWGMLTPCCCFPPSREIPDCQYHRAGSGPSSSPASLLAVILSSYNSPMPILNQGWGLVRQNPSSYCSDLPVAGWLSLWHFISRGLCSQPSRNTHEFPICESILFPTIPRPALPVCASPSALRHGAGGRGGGGLTWGPASDPGQGAVLAFCRYNTQPALLPRLCSLRCSLPPSIPPSDMDECEIFGSEFCRNGQCLNTVPGYKCFCRTGYFYDSSRLECVGKMVSKCSRHRTAHRGTDVLLHPELSLLPRLQGQVWTTGFLGPSRGTREEVEGAPEVPIWAGKGSHCSCLPA